MYFDKISSLEIEIDSRISCNYRVNPVHPKVHPLGRKLQIIYNKTKNAREGQNSPDYQGDFNKNMLAASATKRSKSNF